MENKVEEFQDARPDLNHPPTAVGGILHFVILQSIPSFVVEGFTLSRLWSFSGSGKIPWESQLTAANGALSFERNNLSQSLQKTALFRSTCSTEFEKCITQA